MPTKNITYTLHYQESCNLCGVDAIHFRVLGRRMNTHQGYWPRNKVGAATTIVRCGHCGTLSQQPQMIPASLGDHYDTPPESYWKEDYFSIAPTYMQDQLATLGRLFGGGGGDALQGKLALDIGAGIGKSMKVMEQKGMLAHGLEPSKTFYQMAIDRMGIAPDKLQCAAVETATYTPNTFDFISFGAVLEHLYDPSGVLAQVLPWLKPGGFIHIEVPSAHWLVGRLLNLYYRMIGTDYVTNTSPMSVPFHIHEFTVKGFEENAKRLGYSIAFHQFYVCETYLPKFVDWFIKPVMKWTNTGMQLEIWLQKR